MDVLKDLWIEVAGGIVVGLASFSAGRLWERRKIKKQNAQAMRARLNRLQFCRPGEVNDNLADIYLLFYSEERFQKNEKLVACVKWFGDPRPLTLLEIRRRSEFDPTLRSVV